MNFEKGAHNSDTFWPGLTHVCHAHLHDIGIMFSKFHLNDLKTVEGVWGTTERLVECEREHNKVYVHCQIKKCVKENGI